MHILPFTIVTAVLLSNAILSEGIAVMSIDLGSEWVKIAIVKPGVPMEIVLNKESKRKTEVAVFLGNNEREFGSSAINKGVRFPKATYFYIQDLLGKKLDNPLVSQFQKRFPYYELKEDTETGTVVFVHDAENAVYYSPEELMAMMLNHSKSLAEDYAQQPIDTCVITVPTYYNQAERKALLYSAQLAGLTVSQLMDDNTAAALNYGVFRRHDINTTATYMMFYDMGATSTVASIISYQIVKVNGIADPQLTVKGVGFDRSLGGLDMELRLRDHLIKLFNEKKKTKSEVTESPRAMAKLLKEARRLKKVLSANIDHTAQIEGLLDDEDFKAKVTRSEFEELCSDLWERVAKPMHDAVKSSEITMDLISQVLLIGGGTRIPKVQEILLKESGKTELGKSINADEAAALGASYQAAALSSAFRVKTFHVKAGATYPIEIEFNRHNKDDEGNDVVKHIKRTLFQRNNPYPQRKVITFNRFSDNFNFSVNYGDIKFLSDTEKKVVGSLNISSVVLEGVPEAHTKYSELNDTESKGVKAHFRMDESGILNLESVECVYEQNKTVVENKTKEITKDEEDLGESTYQKIKDGLSSLFGGEASNETKPETDDSKPSPEEKSTEENKEKEEKEEKGEEKGEAEKEKDEGGEEKKEEVEEKTKTDKNETKTETKTVKVKHSVQLDMEITTIDHKKLSEYHDEQSQQKLKVLADRDEFILAREIAMNKLESYIYDKKDKLYTEEYEKALTDKERKEITEALTEASDWMDELEGETAAQVYDEKRDSLKTITKPWLLRVKQRKDMVVILNDLEDLFNYSTNFLSVMSTLPEQTQIYTPVEMKTLYDIINSTVTWKNETLAAEKLLKPYEDPVLLPADARSKYLELNREIQYLINKAKTAKPKPRKEANETKSDSTEKEETVIEDGKKADEETEKDTENEDKAPDSKSDDKIEPLTTEESKTSTEPTIDDASDIPDKTNNKDEEKEEL